MKMLNNEELITFCSQLAMILRAGISAIEGISIMKEDAALAEGGEILGKLYEQMELTGVLHESMRETGVFPEYVCHMTEIGEMSGRLDEVMEGLAIHYEREEDMTQNIKSALTYPMIMLGMMTAVVMVLVMKVMPVFEQVFEELGGGLTGVSAGIMRFGAMMSRYGAVLVVILVAVVAGVCYLAFSKSGKKKMKKFLETSRLTRELSEKMACAKVADGMDLCMRSGLDVDQSLEMAQRLVDHGEIGRRIGECRKLIGEGETFDKAVAQSGIFSGVYAKMVAVGIRTGSVDQVMHKIARQYEDEVTQKMQGIVAVVEPTLVAVLSALVGLILLSVMLPLMGIMASMG